MAVPTLVSMVSSIYIQWIKHEMKEKMEYENIQTITLNNNEFSWYEKGNKTGSVSITLGSNGTVSATKYQGDGSELTGIIGKAAAMALIFG